MISIAPSKTLCSFNDTVELPAALGAREIHVLKLEAARYQAHVRALTRLLDAEEARRIELLRFEEDRVEAVLSRALLRYCLAAYTALSPRSLRFSTGPRGKPSLADGLPRFNVSHSGGVLLFAVSLDYELGVDVERVGDKPFSFYARWTDREAQVKAKGRGVFDPLPERDSSLTSVSLFPGNGYAASLAVRGTDFILKCWEWRPDKNKVEACHR